MQPCLVIGHHQKYCSFPSQAKFLFMVVIAAQIKFLILGYVEVDWRTSCWTCIWSELLCRSGYAYRLTTSLVSYGFVSCENKRKLNEISNYIADVKQELRTPPFPWLSVSQSHFTALLFLHMTTSAARLSFIVSYDGDFPLPSCCFTIVSLFIVSHAACSVSVSWLQMRTAINHM